MDKGSTFWFTLPYIPVQSIKAADGEQEKEVKELLPEDKYSILIAEDNPGNYKLYETVLGKEYNLIHAWNGAEAVDLFKEYNPPLILMDIKMPVMNGYKATKLIREISSSVCIVAVTAFAFEEDGDRILRAVLMLIRQAYTNKIIEK